MEVSSQLSEVRADAFGAGSFGRMGVVSRSLWGSEGLRGGF